MGNTAKFWDRIAERYEKSPIRDEEAYAKKLEMTRHYFKPEMNVLELGCGTGSIAIAHAPYVRHIQAVDISEKMLAIAQSKVDQAKITNITFTCCGVDDFNAADKEFDAVMSFSVLHLLECREQVIANIFGMLKPGGVFISNTACLGASMGLFRCIAPIGRILGLLPLVNVFTSKQLMADLTNAGFEVEHQWQPGKNKGLFVVAKRPL